MSWRIFVVLEFPCRHWQTVALHPGSTEELLSGRAQWNRPTCEFMIVPLDWPRPSEPGNAQATRPPSPHRRTHAPSPHSHPLQNNTTLHDVWTDLSLNAFLIRRVVQLTVVAHNKTPLMSAAGDQTRCRGSYCFHYERASPAAAAWQFLWLSLPVISPHLWTHCSKAQAASNLTPALRVLFLVR